MTNTSSTPLAIDSVYAHSTSNLARLTLAQALAGANAIVIYATGAIVGNTLSPGSGLATLPISILVVGMALSFLPAGVISERYGRRTAFLMGTACGVLVGLLSLAAILMHSFALFCVSTFLGGVYAAVVLTFRFAAADCVPIEKQPRALSFVMAGGVFAGVLGPQMVNHTMHWGSLPLFGATFIAQAIVAALSALVLWGVKLPKPVKKMQGQGRPIAQIVRQPIFISALICGLVSYLVMNFLMTAAPLAMQMCGLPQTAANLGIEWHVIAMYAPSFFTGAIITRYGVSKVVLAGFLLTAVSIGVGLLGTDIAHFWLTLIFLGLGWNFSFVGASTMVLKCHHPEEKSAVQSFNDFAVFGLVAVGSFLSGSLLTTYGWHTILWLSFIPLALATISLIFAYHSTRSD